MKPDLILFDFSGTLAFLRKQPNPKIFFSFFRKLGIEIKTRKEKKAFISSFGNVSGQAKNWLDFSQRIFENFLLKPNKKAIKTLAAFLKENIIFELYDDVKEIAELPFKKAVLSANSRFLIENLSLKTFAKIFTPKETKFLKPDPRAFLRVLKNLKVRPEKTLMVGDEVERDLLPAKKLKMKTVLIDRSNSIKNYSGLRVKSLRELKRLLV